MSVWPRRIDLRTDPERDLADAAEHVRAGGVLAYPTETVYGFGGALDDVGVARVRGLKRREPSRPLLVLVRAADEVADLAWNDRARELARTFWPGALTLVLPDPHRIFPEGVRSEAGGVAVRVSPHPVVPRLLEALDAPLTSTSANAPGEAPATSGSRAEEVARRLGPEHVLVLDAGTLPPSGPSTIVDCTAAEPEVIREGTIPIGRLRCVLPEIHG